MRAQAWGRVGGRTPPRSGLTPTKPESLGRSVPEKICFGDQHGPLSNPGGKVKVPWAGQRAKAEPRGPHDDFTP